MNQAWVTRPLGEIFEIGAGKTMSKAAREGPGKVPFLRTSNVLWDEIDLTEFDEMAIDPAELQQKSLAPGDLLVCEGGEIGRAAVWTGAASPVSFQNHLHRLRPSKPGIEPRFYVYFLQSAFTQLGLFAGAGNKTTIANLSRNQLAALEVPEPSPQEQKDIARVLGAVRMGMTAHQRSVAHARDLKRTAMRELFARGLRSEPQRETEFGPVPQNWRIADLSEVATVQTGVAKGRALGDAEVVEVPYLRVANVQDGHLDLREMKRITIRTSEIDRYRLEPGDVVLTEGGDFDKLGRGFVWNGEVPGCVHQNHVFAVRTHRSVLDPTFLAYLAQSPYGKAYFLKVAHKTTNLACINTTKLKALPVLIPDLSEQQEIVGILDAIDRKIDLHLRKKTVLEVLFRALLHKLMTGDVHVADLDLSALPGPEDAPA